MIIKNISKKQAEILKTFEDAKHNRYARIIEFKREDDIKAAEELVDKQYLIRMSDYAYIRNPYTSEKITKEDFINYFHRYFLDGFPNMLSEVSNQIRYEIRISDKKEVLNTFVILLSILSETYNGLWGYDDGYYAIEDVVRTISRIE